MDCRKVVWCEAVTFVFFFTTGLSVFHLFSCQTLSIVVLSLYMFGISSS